MEIIEYFKFTDCTVRFPNGEIRKNIWYSHICRNQVKNKTKLLSNGGYWGNEGNIKNRKAYKVWGGMLQRCYGTNSAIKYPRYVGCSVCEEWKSFQLFAKWFLEQPNNSEKFPKNELEKDILVKGNKVYSPETCCFVPQEINGFFKQTSKNKNNIRLWKHGTYSSTVKFRGQSFFSKGLKTEQECVKFMKEKKLLKITIMVNDYLVEKSITPDLADKILNSAKLFINA